MHLLNYQWVPSHQSEIPSDTFPDSGCISVLRLFSLWVVRQFFLAGFLPTKKYSSTKEFSFHLLHDNRYLQASILLCIHGGITIFSYDTRALSEQQGKKSMEYRNSDLTDYQSYKDQCPNNINIVCGTLNMQRSINAPHVIVRDNFPIN